MAFESFKGRKLSNRNKGSMIKKLKQIENNELAIAKEETKTGRRRTNILNVYDYTCIFLRGSEKIEFWLSFVIRAW